MPGAMGPDYDRVKVAEVGYDGLAKALAQTQADFTPYGGHVRIKGVTIDILVGASLLGYLTNLPEKGIGYEKADQEAPFLAARELLDELIARKLLVHEGRHVKLAPEARECTYQFFAYHPNSI